MCGGVANLWGGARGAAQEEWPSHAKCPGSEPSLPGSVSEVSRKCLEVALSPGTIRPLEAQIRPKMPSMAARPTGRLR